VLKNYIRNLLLELLNEPTIKPKFAEMKKISFKNKDKATVYDIIDSDAFESIEFSVEYVDPSTRAKCKTVFTGDLSEIRSGLQDIVDDQPIHPYFKTCMLLVSYNHEFGPQLAFDIIADAHGKVYDSKELNTIARTLITWIDSHPEMLV